MYAMIMGACIRCHQVFTFHPNKVPSIRVNGVKEPVCKGCHEALNQERVKLGLERWPEPLAGAYEAAPEEEINWG